MTFNVISDIHYQPTEEYTSKGGYTGRSVPCQIDFEPEKLKPADYLLIAGDLATDDVFEKALDKVRKATEGKFRKIFYVYGNHDFYDISYTKEKPRDNHYVEAPFEEENVVLLGTTLWTPVPTIDETAVLSRMNDFRAIPKWTINEVRNQYRIQSNWLRKKVTFWKNRGFKVVVMTHHCPRIELHSTYERNMKWFKEKNRSEAWGYFASYYVTDHSCDDIKPDVWISGHHHTGPIIKTIDGVKHVRNTIGYSGDWYDWRSQLPPTKWYDFIIEV